MLFPAKFGDVTASAEEPSSLPSIAGRDNGMRAEPCLPEMTAKEGKTKASDQEKGAPNEGIE